MTRHLVLIGAARSGTKLVRDLLAQATGAGAVPYDIGYVWRYGNEGWPHDQLPPEGVTPRIERFINRYVDAYAGDSRVVIEKTVGNTLRVPFVHRVWPEATFVHLVRDGVDVVESTRRQWLAGPDRRYLREKLRSFPLRLVPSYGRKYAASTLSRYINSESRVASWGPRYPGIDDDVRRQDLLTVCARQWKWSVETACRDLELLDISPVPVRYEHLVQRPVETLSSLADAIGLPLVASDLDQAVARVNPSRLGVGASELSPQELAVLDVELGPTLASLGYPSVKERRKT